MREGRRGEGRRGRERERGEEGEGESERGTMSNKLALFADFTRRC